MLTSDREKRRKGKRSAEQKMKREIIKERQRRGTTREERDTSCTRFHCLQRVSLLRISPSLLSFSSSLLSVSLSSLSPPSLSLFAPDSRFFPLRTFIPAISQRRCGSFFSSRCNFCHASSYATTKSLQSGPRATLSFSLGCHLGARKQRERETKKEIDRGSERRQARCGAEWEEARLLEEGRNWGDDLPGERNPETPARARATFLAKTLRFLSMTYPTCLCFCPFVPLSAPALVRAAPGPLSSRPPSMRPLALLFRSPSFTLPRCSRRRYGRFDAEERRYQDDDLR